MKIIGIVGTNVTGGAVQIANQPSLVRTASHCLDKLAAVGHTTEQVNLGNFRIEFCDHCEICDHEETCSLGDDFWPIYEKMKEADAIIFFTSVTYGMMNPKLATFLQRAGRIARSNGKTFAGKASGLLTEEVRASGAPVLAQFATWFESEGMKPP